MKITNKTKNVARGLTGIFAGLLAFSIGTTSVVNTYRSWINTQLGTKNSITVNGEVDPNEDLYNYRVKSVEETGYDLTTTKGVYDYQKAAAIEIASEGIVLLKNNQSLPLAKNSDVTLLGTAAYSVWHGGTMGSMPVTSEKISFVDALSDQGMKVDPAAKAAYEKAPGYGETVTENPWGGTSVSSNLSSLSSGKFTLNESSPADVGLADKSAKGGTAIIVLARQGGENGYYLPGEEGKAVEGQFDADHDVLGLSVKEMETIKYANKNYDNVVVIVNSDSAMDIPELFEEGGEYEVDSVVWAGLPGTYGWVAVAQVLDGTVNPSGAMVDTYAAKSSVNAANQNYGVFTFANADTENVNNEKSSWYMPETEGIYVGYRYYESRYYDCVMDQGNASIAHKGENQDTAKSTATEWNYSDEVVASFGYGLSYTTFSETINSVNVDFNAKTVTAEVTVQNTGEVAGKHAVQLYVSVPYTDYDKEHGIEKSAIQLIGYEKTGLLEKGKSETVTVTADFQYFASYDSEFEHHNTKGAYVLDEGNYVFSVGNGAHDALNNVLASQGKGVSDGMDYAGDAAKAVSKEFGFVEMLYSESGEVIENQLQDMELDNFEENIVELSRSDWNATWPKTYDNLSSTAAMEPGLNCQLYEVHETDNGGKEVIWGADTDYTFFSCKPEKGEWIEYDDERLINLVQQVTLEEAIAAVTQCGGQDWDELPSIESPKIKTTDGPVGYDAERGMLSIDWNDNNTEYDCPDDDPYGQIEMRPLPTMPVIGATFSHEMAEKSGEVLSMLALWSGVAEVWGPGVNIHRTAYNARNHEYYSEDPVHLANMANDFATEAQKNGLVTCLKHFAFNDTEANRSGVAPFMSEQRARELDLRAFQLAIENETALAVMTGFNRAGSTFSSAHKGLITGILREEWDFNGFCLTDMVSPAYYMNPRDAIAAGTDGMLTSSSANNINNNINGWGEFTPEGLADDMDMQQRIQDAVHRALYIFINSNVTNGSARTAYNKWVLTWYDGVLIAATTVTAVLTAVSAAGYVTTKVLLKKNENNAEEA